MFDELQEAKYADFLLKAGVPNGARPIFQHKKTGERVLATGFAGYAAKGLLFKKDGTLSEKSERVLYADQYKFVGE